MIGEMASAFLNPELKPYLKYSAALHVILFVAVLILIGRSGVVNHETYRIDFIGPTAGILNREILETSKNPASAPKAPPATTDKPAPLRDPDAFTRKRKSALPRPSVLSKTSKLPKPSVVPEEEAPPPQSKTPAANVQGQGAPADASVSADMPNFPYPWYIAQVRGTLWAKWSEVMPEGRAETMIEFSILRNGNLTDLRVESSSGERSFDSAATGAVQAAAPFPPLPPGFRDPFLHVHVRFTSQ